MFRLFGLFSLLISLSSPVGAQSQLSELAPWVGTWSTNGRLNAYTGRVHYELAWGYDQRILNFRIFRLNAEGQRHLTRETHLWRNDDEDRLVGTSIDRTLNYSVRGDIIAEIEPDGSLLLTTRLSCPGCVERLASGEAEEWEVGPLRSHNGETSRLRFMPPDEHQIIVVQGWNSLLSPDGPSNSTPLYRIGDSGCIPGGWSADTACLEASPDPLTPFGFDIVREYLGDWINQNGTSRMRIAETAPQHPNEGRADRQHFELIDGAWVSTATGYFSDVPSGIFGGLLRLTTIGEDGVNRITSQQIRRANFSETGLTGLVGNGLLFKRTHFRSSYRAEPQAFESYEYWSFTEEGHLSVQSWVLHKDGSVENGSTQLWERRQVQDN